MAPIMEKMNPFGKKKKKKTEGESTNSAPASTDFEAGSVNQIQSAEHLKAVLERSKVDNFGIVLDFTASWANRAKQSSQSSRPWQLSIPDT